MPPCRIPTLTAPAAPTRSGNSLVLTLGILAAAAAVVTASAISLTANYKTLTGTPLQLKALGAAEAVALLKEKTLVDLATSGDPAAFVQLTKNYGETYVGDVRVRWRIEPAVIAAVASKTATNGWAYITNPDPDPTGTPATPRLTNDYTYLYRIAAEGQIVGADSDPLARAQTVKFAAVDKQPLFRYVIFYAKNGPKGDLEFNHGPGMTIRGNVHSNGAIYLGGAPAVNDWTALQNGSASDGFFTKLGKDDSDPSNVRNIRVTGVDGLFRLNKSVLYSAFNDLPLVGVAPSGWSLATAYNLSANDPNGLPFPGEAGASPRYRVPNFAAGTDVLGFTWNGAVINPSRVKDSASVHTKPVSGNDNLRTINGQPILGATDVASGVIANDSRDKGGRTGYVWKTGSMGASPGFGGYARTEENGGGTIRVSNLLANRPLEAQDLAYPSDDPATPTVDESESHHLARPRFIINNVATTDMPNAAQPFLEAPGAYLTYALGDTGHCMRREGASLSAYTGWSVTNRSGTAITSLPSPGVGLIVRERPRPSSTIYPKNDTDVADPSSKDFMPYAYGKHARPTVMPFTPMSVSDNIRTWSDETHNAPEDTTIDPAKNPWARISTTSTNQRESYSVGGILTARSACAPGPVVITPTNQIDGTSKYTHNQDFYRENWRFIHFRTTSGTTASGGLTASYFPNQGWSGDPFVRTDATVNFTWSGIPTGVTNLPSGDYFSVRWEGEVKVPTTGAWTFRVWANDVCRVWVNHEKIIDQRSNKGADGGGNDSLGTPLTLDKDKRYPIVIEMSEGTGTAACRLFWDGPSNARVIVPSSALYPRKAIPAGGTTVSDVAFNRATFKAAQFRITSLTGGSSNADTPAKVGLMIRDAVGGVPDLINGRDRYTSLLYSPTRGIFTQTRLQPSTVQKVTGNVYFVGDSTTPTANASGEVSSLTGITRRARMQKISSTDTGIQTTVSSPSTQIKTSYSTTSAATVMNNPFSISEGTADKVTVGPVGRRTTLQPQARGDNKTRTATWTFDLTNCPQPTTQVFRSTDVQRTLYFYTSANTASGSSTRTLNAWWWNVLGTGNQIRYTQPYTNDNSWWRDWGTATTRDQTFGTAKVIYDPLPKIYSGANYIRTLSSADAIQFMQNNFGGTYTYGGSISNLKPANPAAPTFTSPLPTTDDPATPITFDNVYYFNVSRSLTVELDLNSYISNSGTWFASATSPFAPNAVACLPTLDKRTPPDWSNTNIDLSGVFTGGFRPDQWIGTGAPPYTFTPTYTAQATSSVVKTRNAAGSTVTAGTGTRWTDDHPTTGAVPQITATAPLWLRIERVGGSGTIYQFMYAFSVNAPTSWNTLPNTVNLASFGRGRTPTPAGNAADLLVGLCMQSGDVNLPVDVTTDNLKIETDHGSPNDVIDATDWDGDAATTTNDWSRYLSSQYQVFFGPFDITEDFFTWNQNVANGRTAQEDWIYNPREFWSQAHTWLTGSNKDGTLLPALTAPRTNRELLAKATLLSLNLRSTQDYLKSRTVDQAVIKRITAPLGLAPAGTPTTLLQANFNGLFYMARTNRYPTNPNTTGASGGGVTGANPYNFYLPNISSSLLTTLHNGTSGITGLQPYSTAVVPFATPLRPQDFLHGVRIVNGASVDWDRPASGTPTFGNSKTSIATPNQLFIQGNLNYASGTWPAVQWRGSTVTNKPTPVAIMGDQITFLSNAFRDVDYQQPGISVSSTAVTGGGTLAFGTTTTLPAASETWYYTSILTHNQPTSRDSVLRGEAASIINTMLYLEDWATKNMNYAGSLVVLDTRRYTQNYLLEAPKQAGLCPFGYALNPAMNGALKAKWLTLWSKGSADWNASIPYVQGPPNRKMQFNYDLLTEQGTPPFTPFGVSVAGKGGWSQVLK